MMNKFQFLTARLLRNESALVTLSVTPDAIFQDLAGKSVALVGNAQALATTTYGSKIDAHDLVIRLNRAPMPSPVSHGTRTDWLALATRLSQADRANIDATRLLWMSHKRKRLSAKLAFSAGFYLHPLGDYGNLKTRLGRQPTTGAMMIDLLVRSKAAKIDLFGFDFFASLSLSGRRTADQVPHDFNAEAQYVHNLIECDGRLTLHAMKSV